MPIDSYEEIEEQENLGADYEVIFFFIYLINWLQMLLLMINFCVQNPSFFGGKII